MTQPWNTGPNPARPDKVTNAVDAPVVASYEATVVDDVIGPTITIVPGQEGTVAKIVSRPGSTPGPWPPASVSDWDAASLEQKVAAYFLEAISFGAHFDADGAQALRGLIKREWPEVVSSGKRLQRIPFSADMRADGKIEYGWETGASPGLPLPIASNIRKGSRRPDVDLFIQNVVRADLLDRLGHK